MRYLSDLAYGAPNQQERFFNGLGRQSVTTREISQGFPTDYPLFHTGPPHAALNATASYPVALQRRLAVHLPILTDALRIRAVPQRG